LDLTYEKRTLIAIGAAAILLAACIPSVNPFYQEKDVIFDPHLLGEWSDKEANNPETWVFEQSTNKGFDVTVTEQGKTGKFRAHLFKLNDAQFLDVIPTDCNYAPNQADLVAFSMFPGHLLMRVAQIEPELRFSACDYDWLQKYLETNSTAIAHHTEYEHIVLTDSTANLQKFVLKHLGTNELFEEYGTMSRRAKE
jgi:hypothetical protein